MEKEEYYRGVLGDFSDLCGCSNESQIIFLVLLEKLSEFDFELKLDEKGECLIANGNLGSSSGQHYLLKIMLHSTSFVLTDLFVQCVDDVQSVVLKNMCRNKHEGSCLGKVGEIESSVAAIKNDVAALNSILDEFQVYRERKASVALLVSRDPDVQKRFAKKIDLIEKDIRLMIPMHLRKRISSNYSLTDGRGSRFCAFTSINKY